MLSIQHHFLCSTPKPYTITITEFSVVFRQILMYIGTVVPLCVLCGPPLKVGLVYGSVLNFKVFQSVLLRITSSVQNESYALTVRNPWIWIIVTRSRRWRDKLHVPFPILMHITDESSNQHHLQILVVQNSVTLTRIGHARTRTKPTRTRTRTRTRLARTRTWLIRTRT